MRGKTIAVAAIVLAAVPVIGAAVFTATYVEPALANSSIRPRDSAMECLPASALDGADIVLLGQYGGKGQETPYQLKGAMERATVTNVVGDPGRPVVLVLSAYDPTVWDLSRVPAGRLRGVVATGFYAQGISGIPVSVPVAMRHKSANNGADPEAAPSACPYTDFAYKGPKVRSAAFAIRSSMGKLPAEFFGSYSTPTFDLSGAVLQNFSRIPPANEVMTEAPIPQGGMPSGNDGIQYLVARGVLRPASDGDVQRLMQQGATFEPVNMPARMASAASGTVMPRSSPGGLYVITRTVDELPSGLFGSHLVNFILPQGIDAPTGMNTHSNFYRLHGVRGIPATSGETMNIWNSMQMGPRSMPQTPSPGERLLHVRWNPDGSLVSETPATNDTDQTHRDSEQSQVGPLVGDAPAIVEPGVPPRPIAMPPTTVIDTFPNTRISEGDGRLSRDMTPSALISALLLALGAFGLLLRRRGAMQRSVDALPLPDRREALIAAPAAALAAPVDDEIETLSRQLQAAIDVSRDDDTALVLLKFKRTVLRALQEPDYDDDLANELDAIVDKHMGETISIYVKAAKRTTGPRVAVLEANLRSGVQRLTERIDEIIDSQSARDSDKLRERDDFIHARHPGAGGLGDGK